MALNDFYDIFTKNEKKNIESITHNIATMKELPYGAKLIVTEYYITKRLGLEILIPVDLFMAGKGREQIVEAIQAVQEYLLSLE